MSFVIYSTLFLLLFLTISIHFSQNSYAHDFFVNNEVALVTLIEQIKAETELVNTNFVTNNNVSALVHTENAAELMNKLEDTLMETPQQSPSGIDKIYENRQRNSTTLALVVANIVDEILRKYGVAFDIDYDLTNMSNMGGMRMSNRSEGGSSSAPLSHSMNMTSFQNSTNSGTLEGHSNMPMMMPAEGDLDLVSIHDYETSHVLADVVNKIFEEDLRLQSSASETVNIDRLESNLQQLEHAIINKASPEALMEIVHVQIHPTLQLIYDLELLGNAEVTENSK